ncbi:hypothetical protein Trydic_g11846 [Trypoxylus dichotomus]
MWQYPWEPETAENLGSVGGLQGHLEQRLALRQYTTELTPKNIAKGLSHGRRLDVKMCADKRDFSFKHLLQRQHSIVK